VQIFNKANPAWSAAAWGLNWVWNQKEATLLLSGMGDMAQLEENLKLVDEDIWEFCQIQYNYSDENFQAGVTGLRKAAAKMPVVIMEPLLGGKLVGGLPAEAVQIFKKAKPALSSAAWGLNWVWNQKEVALLLSGMGDMAQLEENLKLADAAQPGMLGEGDAAAYHQVLELVNRAYKIRCTGCNYCMPCPRGVNIPGCFSTYNTSYAIGYVEGMKQFVTSTGLTTEKSGSPSLCVKCGKCESHCPQHIEIIKSLGYVRRRMEPLWIKGVGVVARAFLGKKRKAAHD
jgi:predicted aldo/keto reductase-like oxidoreductase